ncbi:thiamine pyrophosphate-binding protein [Pseudobacillus badius]|uniref:thiamine pyrophosphate-binding protein n=1 Tax=Bacillus badius TaxID=1455 RepID=UPI0007B055B0|nr:thiamine pyrophosphate-binding protein [Bacillus badius]KZN99664.1 pyruvate oxidase [Bacillus badius]OCS85769.1 pyruvate oxidase [Bacillus badius]OVE51874.1 pyruvate oxidase [Bacillus badius]TDW03303.1 pyruvate dehydrogenase (quinone)/pyruvate oxidase [Bacillus badius]UAT32186.1 thiamine pyrophosphate-binding protein [Bacillus badius]
MKQTEQTVAELILEQLSLFGVKRIYGVVGDGIFGLIDALAKQDTIKFIAVKHEATAAFMASAEAKLTGNLAVCAATMGPGAANLLNGLGDAYADKVPVLAITGQAPRNKIGTAFKQYVNQQELMKPFAAYSENLASQDAIIELLHKAAQTSLGQRAVSHLSIPKDLFEKIVAVQPRRLPSVIEGVSTFTKESLEQAAAIMKTAERPMILAGAGAAAAAGAIETLAASWGAGILTSLGGKGLFPDSSPHLLQGIGEGGNPYAPDLFKQADVVLLAGTTWWPEGYVPAHARIIQIDKHFDKIEKGIPAELGITGETEEVLPFLIEELQGFSPSKEWADSCGDAKEKWAQKNEQEGRTSGYPFYPSHIVRAIEQTVAADAILTLDTGDVTVWMNRNFRPNEQTVLFSGYWRTMGFGLPAAMAAKLEKPEKQVVAVVGDGGLQMTLADLLTAARYELDITVVVFNNEALQMERDKLKAAGQKETGTKLTNPDFVKMAESCGWKSFRAEPDSEIEAVLAKALNTPVPALVDIPTAQAFFPGTK